MSLRAREKPCESECGARYQSIRLEAKRKLTVKGENIFAPESHGLFESERKKRKIKPPYVGKVKNRQVLYWMQSDVYCVSNAAVQ